MGLLLAVVVHAANVPDCEGARWVLQKAASRCGRLRKIWVDAGYRGPLLDWAEARFGWVLEVVQHGWTAAKKVWVKDGEPVPERPAGFQVLPKRWIVERTFAWIGWHRRLSKDYEFLPENSEAMAQVAMIRLMLRRLGREP